MYLNPMFPRTTPKDITTGDADDDDVDLYGAENKSKLQLHAHGAQNKRTKNKVVKP